METPISPNNIIQARPEDYEGVLRLLDAANDYTVQKSGVPGWTAMAYVYSQIKKQIEKGELFVIKNSEGQIAGSIAFNEDVGQWGEEAKNDPALYFQKYLKDPSIAEPDTAKKLFSFMANEAILRNKSLLRCDTVSELPGLLKYYEDLGFTQKATFIYESSGRPGVLLEAETQTVIDRIG